MNCKFFVGQKVTPKERVTNWGTPMSDGTIFWNPDFPKPGNIYTVTGFSTTFELVGIYLAEIKTGVVETGGIEGAWAHESFRPVSDRGTEVGVALLKRIVKTGKLPRKQKENA